MLATFLIETIEGAILLGVSSYILISLVINVISEQAERERLDRLESIERSRGRARKSGHGQTTTISSTSRQTASHSRRRHAC